MKQFQGLECIQRLIRLREEMVSGTYKGPINGIISNGENKYPFTIRDANDIEVLGKFGLDQVPFVRIWGTGGPIFIDPEKPHSVKLGNDGLGKPIFLSISNN